MAILKLRTNTDVYTTQDSQTLLEVFVFVDNPEFVLNDDLGRSAVLDPFKLKNIYFNVEMDKQGQFAPLYLSGDGHRLRAVSDIEAETILTHVEAERGDIVSLFAKNIIEGIVPPEVEKPISLLAVFMDMRDRIEKHPLLPLECDICPGDLQVRQVSELYKRLRSPFSSEGYSNSLEQFEDDIERLERRMDGVHSVADLVVCASKHLRIQTPQMDVRSNDTFRLRFYSKKWFNDDSDCRYESKDKLLLDFSMSAIEAQTFLGVGRFCDFFGLNHDVDHFTPHVAPTTISHGSIIPSMDIIFEAWVERSAGHKENGNVQRAV